MHTSGFDGLGSWLGIGILSTPVTRQDIINAPLWVCEMMLVEGQEMIGSAFGIGLCDYKYMQTVSFTIPDLCWFIA